MKNLAAIFLSVSLALDFVASFFSTKEDKRATTYINCIWSALVILAWGYVARGYLA